MNINKYLKQLYPPFESKWKIIIPISLFIPFFLEIFLPFGLAKNAGHSELLISGYGIITFLVLTICLYAFPLIARSWFDCHTWTMRKQIIWMACIVLAIGTSNYFYSIVVFSLSGSINEFVRYLFFTTAVGIFPIIVLTFIQQNILLKKNLRSASDINAGIKLQSQSDKEGHKVKLNSENNKDSVL